MRIRDDVAFFQAVRAALVKFLSDEFLAEVRGMAHRNLAVELLRKLLNDELRVRSTKYLVQSRKFSEMLEAAVAKYKNRAVETAQVIEEMIALAREMREANRRGEELGLIARELVQAVRKSATIDWTMKESVRAKIRVMVKRILRKYGSPPDKQEEATQTVLEQAEVLCKDWAG